MYFCYSKLLQCVILIDVIFGSPCGNDQIGCSMGLRINRRLIMLMCIVYVGQIVEHSDSDFDAIRFRFLMLATRCSFTCSERTLVWQSPESCTTRPSARQTKRRQATHPTSSPF